MGIGMESRAAALIYIKQIENIHLHFNNVYKSFNLTPDQWRYGIDQRGEREENGQWIAF